MIPHGTPAQVVNACIKNAPFWNRVTVLRLEENMRAKAIADQYRQAGFIERAAATEGWSERLLAVGNGEGEAGRALLPEYMYLDTIRPEALIDHMYEGGMTEDAIIQNAILSARNDDVTAINTIALRRLPGVERTYLSADSLPPDEQRPAGVAANYPVELLNTLNPSGLPPHRLSVKVGAPIILLRNLKPRDGLMNGTRLIVRELRNNYIVAQIKTGSSQFIGNSVLIPRIDLTPSSTDNAFIFTRRQFPLRLAFGMTINKAQGQTLRRVGLYLPHPCFSHGQLYVALSRTGDPYGIKVMGESVKKRPDGRIAVDNIVFRDVLQ